MWYLKGTHDWSLSHHSITFVISLHARSICFQGYHNQPWKFSIICCCSIFCFYSNHKLMLQSSIVGLEILLWWLWIHCHLATILDLSIEDVLVPRRQRKSRSGFCIILEASICRSGIYTRHITESHLVSFFFSDFCSLVSVCFDVMLPQFCFLGN